MSSIQTWLDHLQVIYPVEGLLHVGIGTNAAISSYSDWNIPTFIGVDASHERIERIAETIHDKPGWSVTGKLLAARTGKRIFYQASNLNESGLLLPETLKPLWQNLETTDKQTLGATTIKAVIEEKQAENKSIKINWVYIDCLPGLAILKGANEYISGFDVVIVRAIIDESILDNHEELNKSSLDSFMTENGFDYLAHEAERHPAIARIIYVRNAKKALKEQSQQYDRQIEKLTNQLQLSQGEAEAQKTIAEELQKRIVPLTQQNTKQSHLVEKQQAKINQMEGWLKDHIIKSEKYQKDINEISKERYIQQRLAETRLEEINQLKADMASVKQLNAAIAQLTAQRDEQSQLAEKYQAEAKRLQQEKADQQAHRDEAATTIQSLIKERDELKLQIEKQSKELKKLHRTIVTQSRQQSQLADKLEAELADSRKTSHMATRLQLAREADLKALQQKHSELSDNYDIQHELLQKLQSKLVIASQYFHQLENNLANPEPEILEKPKAARPAKSRKKQRGNK